MKRLRESYAKDDGEYTLDPIVEETLSRYEERLAYFMGQLSPLLEKYSKMLEAALPHNPKAPFYYYRSDESASAKDGTDATGPSAPAKEDLKEDSGRADEPPPRSPVVRPDPSPDRSRTSPLLRRPQLDAQTLQEVSLEARADFERRCGSPTLRPTERSADSIPPLSAEVSPFITGSAPAFPGMAQQAIKAHLNRTLPEKKPAAATPAGGNSPHKDVVPSGEADDDKKDEAASQKTVAELLDEVAVSPILLAQLRLIKKEAQELMLLFDQIHDWIAMRAPALHDGDSDSLRIMQNVINDLASLNTSLGTIYEMEKDFVVRRSTLEVQLVRNADVSAIKHIIFALDSTRWDDIEASWRVMQRAVIFAHNQLAKNMKTLMAPTERRSQVLTL